MTTLNATRWTLFLFGYWGAAVNGHAQNLLQNSGFELPVNDNPLVKNTQTYTVPSTIGAAWHVEGGSGAVNVFQCDSIKDLHKTDGLMYCPAGDGTQYLSLSTQGSKAVVWQEVPTRTGGRYLVRFKVAAANNPASGITSTVLVAATDSVTGQPIGSKPAFPIDPKRNQKGNPLTWTPAEFYFRAAAGSTRITLSDLTHNPDDTSFIDGVTLEEKPTRFEINKNVMFLGLVVLGFALLYLIVRRRGVRA